MAVLLGQRHELAQARHGTHLLLKGLV
jgi:hypothetical protein